MSNWTTDDLKRYTQRRLSHEQRARETIQREGLPKPMHVWRVRKNEVPALIKTGLFPELEEGMKPKQPAKPKAHGSRYSLPVVLAWFKEMGLPEPVPEFRFDHARKWRFDFAFCPGSLISKVAVEVQGGNFSGGAHVRGAALTKEYCKLNRAAELGWRVLFVQPADLCTSDFAETIKRALNPHAGSPVKPP